MRGDNYYLSENLYFSEVYGNGIYQWNGKYIQDPFIFHDNNMSDCPLLTNILTNETFFMRKAECDQNMVKLYREKICNLPDREYILWPSDIVSLSQAQDDDCISTVDRQYTWDKVTLRGNTGVLFPLDETQNMIPLGAFINRMQHKNWKSGSIQALAIQLVETVLKLNETGCLYNELHLDKIFIKNNGKMYFDYSGLTYPSYKYKFHRPDVFLRSERYHYPVEFAEPAVILGKKNMPDRESQNYSVAALLFYMFIGRHCYDGRLLAGFMDGDEQQHYIRFKAYHRMAVFIFDPEDDRNRLGSFIEEERLSSLWQDLPERIRDLFTRSLSIRGEDVPTPIDVVSLEEWMECFHELGWDKEVV